MGTVPEGVKGDKVRGPKPSGKPLSALAIRQAQPGRTAIMRLDREVPGLYLRVLPSGAKGWILRFQLHGRRRDYSIGSAREYPLGRAREIARYLREQIRAGIDPVEERAKERAAAKREKERGKWTFKACAHAVHETLAPEWRNPKHADQWINTLATFAFPSIGTKSVGEIEVGDILGVLKPIWSTKAETARRVRQRIDAVMRWAVAHGHADKNPVLAASELLPKQRDKTKHHSAMPYRDVPAFVAALHELDPAPARFALEFLILTAARSGEVRAARWDEVDLDQAMWLVPAERMKAGKEHRIPLSSSAIQALEKAKERFGGEGLIFPSPTTGKPLSDMALMALLRRLKVEATAHGFRSSFRDWCAENGVSRELAERALAHTVKDATEAAYHRTEQFEQRRPVMGAWGQFVAIGAASGNVANLRR